MDCKASPRVRAQRIAIAVVTAASCLGVASSAQATSKKALEYRYGTVWSAAVRLIRVDRRYPVSDKDRKNGFILFTFPGKGSVKKCVASLEFLQNKDSQGYSQVELKLRIQHQPRWVEMQFLDHLERKLRDEQGPPPARRAPPRRKPDKPKKPEDGKGKDKGKSPIRRG